MAIQFHCPHCSATLKVPDAASGKKGVCPKCGSGLLVPRIQAPAAPRAAPVIGAPEALPAAPEPPARSSQESADPLAFLAHVEPTLPVAGLRRPAATRNLRRRSLAGILVPLLFCAAFLGAAGWLYFREATARLEGTLQAVALDDEVPPPGFITQEDVDLPGDVFIDALKQMQASPLPDVRSNLMEVDFAAQAKAIEVRVRSTPDTQFFRVDLGRNAALRRFRDEHAKELNAPRRAELTKAATEMFRDWQESGGRRLNLARHRDSAGLASLLGPMGYNMQAVVGGRIYRCVAEDGESRVYFLLPPETIAFRLEGRELANGRVLFPGQYEVKVIEARPVHRDEKPESSQPGTSEEPRKRDIDPEIGGADPLDRDP